MSIITITTDFGSKNEFVSVMKGVILGISPAVQLVDVTHAIAPQNILDGAFAV
ncbi:MAG: SAM-dependent chlorinase/fluorinase, partial [Anaerolineae bacterium]|nr:SAM-dependent chlorinase/fluorinase [Anaerolineae bacterium]